MDKIVLIRDKNSKSDTFINCLKSIFPEAENKIQRRNSQSSHIGKLPSATDIIERFSKRYLGDENVRS